MERAAERVRAVIWIDERGGSLPNSTHHCLILIFLEGVPFLLLQTNSVNTQKNKNKYFTAFYRFLPIFLKQLKRQTKRVYPQNIDKNKHKIGNDEERSKFVIFYLFMI